MLSPNTILQNRYRVVRELGHGGMGTVYEAIDQRVNCIVALKETMHAHDSIAREAFEREAALLANLRHQALPKVMDYFSENSGDFLVMEFIPGYDLAELLDLRGSPFGQSQVLRWADDLLRVLEYLHSREPPILHRDIKPSNLKLTKAGEVFLLDFGLAKGSLGQMPTLLTSRSVRGYTPVYAPLEQILSQGTDARSDIYSLGATLYHILSGVAPIAAPTRFQTIEDGEPDPLEAIHKLNPEASQNVSAVIHQAMAMSRKQRPVSATEMRKALRNAAEEDERSSAEEEYRRAEESRRQREEEKRRTAEQQAKVPAEHVVDLERAQTIKRTPASPQREISQSLVPKEADKDSVKDVASEEQVSPAEALTSPSAKSPALIEFKKGKEPPVQTIRAQGPQIPPGDMLAQLPRQQAVRAFKLYRGLKWFVAIILISGYISGFVVWMFDANTSTPSNIQQVQPTDPAAEAVKAGTVVRNRNGMELVWVPPGNFMMGSENGDPDEKPVHRVTISSGIYMGKYEVTQAQWQAQMGNSRGHFKGDNLPVEMVTWDEVQTFIKKLNDLNDGFSYRLPTEAEWEYACRAGTTGDDIDNLDGTAWYNANSGYETHPVGTKQPNGFGLHDMLGNVWEWCQDVYHENYKGAPTDGSGRLSGGEQNQRVLRGGSERNNAGEVRSAVRYRYTPNSGSESWGFRVVGVR